MEEYNETQIRYLEAIQAVISRMASNSFMLKSLTGSIAVAVIAYVGAAASPSPLLPAASCISIFTFGLLDAKYLRLERLFRKLFDAVRKGEVTEPFDMNFTRYNSVVDGHIKTVGSWSVMWFYWSLLIVMVVLFSFLMRG
ncbi:MAG: hypothetical protein JKY27_01805 [Magnetovibrio sp.]|nr:hypothetical protein [Magnetovibrio sp.]